MKADRARLDQPEPTSTIPGHVDCTVREVGLCVYCDEHGRLYQGRLPEAMRQKPCTDGHDWDPDKGEGFYFVCMRCSEREWAE